MCRFGSNFYYSRRRPAVTMVISWDSTCSGLRPINVAYDFKQTFKLNICYLADYSKPALIVVARTAIYGSWIHGRLCHIFLRRSIRLAGPRGYQGVQCKHWIGC